MSTNCNVLGLVIYSANYKIMQQIEGVKCNFLFQEWTFILGTVIFPW